MEGGNGGSARPATSRPQLGFLEYESNLRFLFVFWFSFSDFPFLSLRILVKISSARNTKLLKI